VWLNACRDKRLPTKCQRVMDPCAVGWSTTPTAHLQECQRGRDLIAVRHQPKPLLIEHG
jgi:hypothetical protein